MARALLLMLLFLFGTAAALPAGGIETLGGDAGEHWVPFARTAGNQIRFTAFVDGRAVDAVLDTGVSVSVVSRRFAQTLGKRVQPRGRADAIGGDVALGWTATRSISIGALDRQGGGIAVADLPATATGDARGADLLVGADLIGGYAVDIDYGAARFRLLPSGALPFRGTTAPLGIATDAHLYVTELHLGGTRLRPVVVDTGDGGAVSLAREAWAASGAGTRATTSTIAYGLAGPEESALTILPMLALGPVEAHEVEVRIEPSDGFSRAIGVAGRIGTGLLERYRVLLDPGAGRMVLAASTTTPAPPMRSTSGLLTRREVDRLLVLHVMRGSPAAATGWRAGEAICAVDGHAITAGYAATSLADWSIGAPGRIVALRLCDGGERRLTLNRFY